MVLWLLLLACAPAPTSGDPDGDGAARDVDCDEGDPDVFPGAPEFCRDGVVNDCADTEADARAFCALWRDVTAEEASALVRGDGAGDETGAAVAGVGDVTGDGVPDVLVGAPGYGEGGAAWVIGGGLRGREDVNVAEAVLFGDAEAGQAGAALAGLGDIDGDGVGDVVVAAPGGRTDDEGRAYVLRGPFAGEYALEDGIRYRAEPGVGEALAVGDVDGDGAVDLLLGAPDLDAGAVYLVRGPLDDGRRLAADDAWFLGDTRDAEAGAALAVGDLDGDGVGDLAVGLPGADGGRGAVVLLRGPASGTVAEIDADLVLTGVTETGAAGAALASGGDVNGDGRADLLVGAPGMEDGTAYLLEGLAAGPLDEVAVASLVAVRSFDDAGAGVAILGDIDADGFADIGVGAPQVGTASGAVYVVFGPVRGEFGLTDADIVITTAYDEDELGRVFTGVGDLDGDGRDDFALGSPLHSEGGNDTGAAWLFLAAPI